jgi:hypothetical protein
MIRTIRSMTKEQREAVADACIYAACASFLLGFLVHSWINDKPEQTWGEVVSVMPLKIKEDIAIDFCVAHRRMCRNIPLSSPINPKD